MPGDFHYGGQAVIEGVMMRGRRAMAVAVRRPDGEVALKVEPLSPFLAGRWRQVPLVRGVLALAEALTLGVRALLYSANVALGQEGEVSGAGLWASLGMALAFVIGIFFIAPTLAVGWLLSSTSSLVGNLVEGVLRLGLFLLYLWAISWMGDIRRLFAYHGAEHKAINAYEAGAPLEAAALRGHSTAHTRCGTGFLLLVLVVAVVVFAFLGQPPLALRLLSRLALLPVIAALSYELMLLGARHHHKPLVGALLAPGLALQSMTTREPDEGQLEVALEALRGVLEADA